MATPPEKQRRQLASSGSGDEINIRPVMRGQGKNTDDEPIPGQDQSKRKRTGSQDTKQMTRKRRPKDTSLHSFFNLKTLSQSNTASAQDRTERRQITHKAHATEVENDTIEEEYIHDKRHSSTNAHSLLSNSNALTVPKRSFRDESFRVVSQKLSELPPPTDFQFTPWSDAFPPVSIEELVVNKTKVLETKRWLEEAADGHPLRRLLVIKGPAGCGKSVTTELLARLTKFDIVKWKNPEQAIFGEENYSSMSSQLRDFLSRGNNFSSLKLSNLKSKRTSSADVRFNRSLFLIEEFPISTRSEGALLETLRETIALHLHGTSSSPAVMIFSEDEANSAGSTEAVTSYQIMGSDVLHHPNVSTINFNKIAPTFMLKALNLVVKKASRELRRSINPGPKILKVLTAGGDLRSSIGRLQMLCENTGSQRNPESPLDGYGSSLHHKEESLGLFHAIAKILYNKRELPAAVNPPEYLAPWHRASASSVDVEELSRLMSVEADTFIAALHENYIPSCNAADTLDRLEAAAAALSCADTLTLKASHGVEYSSFNASNLTASVDIIRHREIVFDVAAYGILFSLPSPVTRKMKRPGFESHKMVYPHWYRHQRSVSEYKGCLTRSLLRSIGAHSNRSERGVLPYQGNKQHIRHIDSSRYSNSIISAERQAMSLPKFDDFVLVHMPYLALIGSAPIVLPQQVVTALSARSGIPMAVTNESLQTCEGAQHFQSKSNAYDNLAQPENNERGLELSDDEIQDS